MSIVITDATLLQKLAQASGTLDVRDAQGNFLGTFAPPQSNLPKSKSPFTDEEIERRRKEPDRRKLADILRDLDNRE